ncbi:MAG: arsenate reductase (glutaredoxin) [Pseudomonadota bacterium]
MANESICIYHNPRCSKSRSALAILEEKGIAAEVIEYLKTPPTKIELRNLLKKLGMKPEEIVRKSEEVYKSHYQGKVLSDEEWLDALIENPILIERPIILTKKRAVIGRPPERVLELL